VVDLTAGVAVRLTSLCLDRSGRLRDFALWDTAVRGALLVDLALAGRVTLADESVTIDDTPTGSPPADALLAAIAVEPERSLDWWLDHGGVQVKDVVAANVATGRWRARRRMLGRRYADAQRDTTAQDRARDSWHPDDTWTPETAAVKAIACAAGADGSPPASPPEAVLVHTGRLRWICQAVTDHLAVAHDRNRQSAGAAGSGVTWL
jgi:hypothetical protein